MSAKTIYNHSTNLSGRSWYASDGGQVGIEPLPPTPSPVVADKENFETRDQMLIRTLNTFPDEFYSGLENSFKEKILGMIKRLGYIIKCLSIEEGLRNYQRSLEPRACEMINYSFKRARNFRVIPIPKSLVASGSRPWHKLTSISYWLYNGPQKWKPIGSEERPIAFKEEGKIVVLHDTVTSSRQKNRNRLANARRIEDEETEKTIVYTGRPGTKEKAIEQVNWMLQSELKKEEKLRRGLTCNEDGYLLTYIVNDLSSSNPLQEERVLHDLEGFLPDTINGKRVYVKPLYFVEAIDRKTISNQTRINRQGLEILGAFESSDPLVQVALTHLESGSLLPEEALFYRILIAKQLNLGEVIHCKSNNSRTSVGTALSMTLQGWLNLEIPLDPDHPHNVLSNPHFQEIYRENLIGGLPVTHQAHALKEKDPIPGFDSLTQNPTVLRLLPDAHIEPAILSLITPA